MDILKFINDLRETDKYIETIFTRGGCYQFHLLLKKYFDCTLHINSDRDHVVSCYEGKYYDITGVCEREFFYELTDDELQYAKRWSFGDNMLIQLGECEFCEEPLIAYH